MRRNCRKHINPNPLHRMLLGRFHDDVAALVQEVQSRSHCPRILDVGCGEGFVVDFLRQKGYSTPVVGLDADRLPLGLARHLGVDIVQGSAATLPFADDAFPLVLCLEVLEHLARPEPAVMELCRVSSNYVIASVPNQPFFSIANLLRGKNLRTLGDDPEHLHHWTGSQFLNLVSTRLHVEKVIRPFPWILVLCSKI